MNQKLQEAVALLQTDKQKANRLLRSYVASAPGQWQGYFYLAASASNLQDYDQACRLLVEAKRRQPNHADILFNLGYCHRQMGRSLDAHLCFKQAFAAAPWRQTHTLVLYASSLADLGHGERALALLKEAKGHELRDPLVNFYAMLIGGDATMRSTMRRATTDPRVVDALVCFSMKHDYYRYGQIDNKASLTHLIRAYELDHKLERWTFHPQSFVLPTQRDDLLADSQHGAYWICKRSNLSGGQGIRVMQGCETLDNNFEGVVQRYVHNPRLLEGRKFNLRTFIVFPTMNPQQALLWHDALVFIAPRPFSLHADSLDDVGMHIANLLASGQHPNRVSLQEIRSNVMPLNELIEAHHFDQTQAAVIRENLKRLADAVVKTMEHGGIFEHQGSSGAYAPKFIGLDIILDDQLTAWLLELERYPGVGGVFPDSKAINDRFKQDYMKFLLGDELHVSSSFDRIVS